MRSCSLSVVISSRDRRQLLEEALRHIASSDYEDFEVVVVFDEESDSSLRHFSRKSLPREVRFYQGEHRGLTSCRNLGILRARGDLILVLDDDLMAVPSLITSHVRMHGKFPGIIVKGNVQPASGATLLCEMISMGNFAHRGNGEIEDFALGSNFSVKREHIIRAGMYDERFMTYGWEGTELTWRLIRSCGLRIRFCREAIAWHKNPLTFPVAARNLFESGKSMVFMLSLHPEVLQEKRSARMAALLQQRVLKGSRHVPPLKERMVRMRMQLQEAEEQFSRDPGPLTRTRLLRIYGSHLRMAFTEGVFQALKGISLPGPSLSEDVKPNLIPLPLEWRAFHYSLDGYGQSCRDYVSALRELGCPVKISHLHIPPDLDHSLFEDYEQSCTWKSRIRPQVLINHCHPGQYYRMKNRYCIGYTPHETTAIPGEWALQADAMDEIWVPSTFARDSFRNSGVSVPVHVIPHGINPRIFFPFASGEHFILNSRFIFLSMGSFYLFKGFDVLLSAYMSEFSPDEGTLLLLRTSLPAHTDRAPGFITAVVEEIASRGGITMPPPVMIWEEPLATGQIAELINMADAYISPSRGEGFGLSILEAMACQKPIVSTAFGGVMDFLTAHNSYLLDYELTQVEKTPNPFRFPVRAPHQGNWAEPDAGSLRHALRHVFTGGRDVLEKAARGRRDVLASWTRRHAALKILGRLGEVIG